MALSQLIQIVLVESDEALKRLKHDFFVSHIGDGVDEADTVECELDEVALARAAVQVIANQVVAVLLLLLHVLLEDQRVCRLYVVVDDVARQDASLTLGQIEQG